MTNETQTQDDKIYYLYRITNKINDKIYIGQSIDPIRRWYEHKRSASSNSCMIISRAIKKYGNNVFIFEVIATCKTYEDANEIETLLVSQYNSLVPNGYNVSLGGMNAPKSEAWKKIISQKAQERAPKTSEQMRDIAANRPEDYYDHFNGNQYAKGIKHTDEWKEMMSNRFHSEEEKLNISEGLKKAYAEGRKVSATKIKWTEEQIIKIKSDTRSSYKISEEYGVSSRTIRRIRNQ